MSNDVAVLGLAVDSSNVVQATSALSQFATAAKPAVTAANALAVASDAHSASMLGQRQALRGLTADLALLGSSYGSTAAMVAELYLGNSHLIENFSGLKSAISEIITPTNLMIGGFAGLVVGSVLAFNSWKNYALALDDVAKQAGTTTSAMSQLEAAASFKGIDVTDFTKGIGGFSAQVEQARNNMGTLVDVLRANGVSAAGDFATVFGKAADLIKNAGDNQERLSLLQQMGLPATMQWVQFMSQGAAGIKSATDQAVAFGGAANDEMVAKAKEFDEAWNKAWTNFGLYARNAVVTAGGYFTTFNDAAVNLGRQAIIALGGGNTLTTNLLKNGFGTPTTTDQSDIANFYKSVPGAATSGLAAAASSAGKKTIDPNVAKNNISTLQPLLGPLGQAPSAQQIAEKASTQPKPAKDENDRDNRRRAA